jgi:hypothetical protein
MADISAYTVAGDKITYSLNVTILLPAIARSSISRIDFVLK